MSEEVEQEGLSIKVPFITEEEIRYVDNNMEIIVNTLTKQIIKDKDLAIAQHIIQRLQQENEANKKRIEELEEGFNNSSYRVTKLTRENTDLKYKLFNSIPKAKVEEKIKKYKEMSDDFYIKFLEGNKLDKDIHDVGISCDAKVQVLEELLKYGGE